MGQNPKILATLLAQLPDNTTGDISAEDIRDVVVSLFPSRGQLDLTASALTTFATTNTYVKLAGSTVLDTTLGQDGFTQFANNELQATKAVAQVLLVTANVELVCTANNKSFGITIAKNGTPLTNVHVSAILSDSNEEYGYSVTALIPVVQNDKISVYVRNETDTTSVRATSLALHAVGFIQ